MKHIAIIAAVFILFLTCSCETSDSWLNLDFLDSTPTTFKVAVVTGGHKFDEAAFLPLFEGHDDIEATHIPLQDNSEIFEDISDWDYDVIVFFNMTDPISPKRAGNFIELMDRGVGVVTLHHAMAAFQMWPEFEKIVGVRYYRDALAKATGHPRSTFKHDIDIRVTVEDASHPITKGLADFVVQDETYKGSTYEADNHVLLTTDNETSDRTIGWVRTYRNARCFTFQPGHGPGIFSDPNYRQIVAQAIRWTGTK